MNRAVQTSALLLLAALLVAAGWWLARRPDPALLSQLADLRTTNLQLDSAIQAYRAAGPSADTVIVRARAAAAVHDTVRMRLIDSVLVVAPDTLFPILTRIRAEHVAAIADLGSALSAEKLQRQAAESLLARCEQLRAANLALAGTAVKRSGGSLFVMAVGVGATYTGERVAVGPSVLVGVRISL